MFLLKTAKLKQIHKIYKISFQSQCAQGKAVLQHIDSQVLCGAFPPVVYLLRNFRLHWRLNFLVGFYAKI